MSPSRPFKLLNGISDFNLGWLAGVLEGEGTFIFQVTEKNNAHLNIAVYMTDADIIKRIAQLMGGNFGEVKTLRKAHHKKMFYTKVTGPHAAHIMEYVLPFMGERRQIQIRAALIGYENRTEIQNYIRRGLEPKIKITKVKITELSLEELEL